MEREHGYVPKEEVVPSRTKEGQKAVTETALTAHQYTKALKGEATRGAEGAEKEPVVYEIPAADQDTSLEEAIRQAEEQEPTSAAA